MLSSKSRAGSSSSKSTKVTPFSVSESQNMKVSDMQQQLLQLQEELKKERDEKNRALEELAELKRKTAFPNRDESNKRTEMLEREVEKAKQSERKMLESLIAQTKQLEQTKISLEETKLEIASIQESNRIIVNSEKFSNYGAGGEIRALRYELKLAIEAEEKSNKAMDDLAIALKEVKAEADEAKQSLVLTQNELDTVKTEAEEMVAAWQEKEKGFINCIKTSEDEVNRLKQENMKLIESQKVIREENANLRENVKKLLNELSEIKEELEISQGENYRLNNLLTEKQDALQEIKDHYESLKLSEVSAQHSLKELKNMIGGTYPADMGKSMSSFDSSSLDQAKRSPINVKEDEKKDGSLKEKDKSLASFSNVSEMKAPSVVFYEEFEQLERASIDSTVESIKKNKKKTVFGRFGDMLKGKNFNKPRGSSSFRLT